MPGALSYWILPVISAGAWLVTLVTMLVYWYETGKPHYKSFDPKQTFPYISDIGASKLKPLFITGSSISVVIFNLTLAFERYLRHKGRLARNTSQREKTLSVFAVLFSLVGGAGLILLAIYDTRHYPRLHDVFLGTLIGGYMLASIFVCLEFRRLGKALQQDSMIMASYWTKVIFVVVAAALVTAFVLLQLRKKPNTAAYIEWSIALVFILFILSFAIDFLPAVRTRDQRFPMAQVSV